jgi:hypothetical protein
MNDDAPAIHINDFNNEDTFPVNVYSNVIPRVGDVVMYWVDYPTHVSRERRGSREIEKGEPQRIAGKVESVIIEYRVMDYSKTRKLVCNVSVYLSDYQVTLYPEDKEG